MAFVVKIGGAVAPAQVSTATMTTKQLEEKIRSIDAVSIEQIGKKVAEKIVMNLGPVKKTLAMQKVNEALVRQPTIQQGITFGSNLKATNRPFLNEKQTSDLKNALASLACDKIKQSFSIPAEFLAKGLSVQLSEKLEGDEAKMLIAIFFHQIAKDVGITLYEEDVPTQFGVRLMLDHKLTQQKQTLTFSLILQSEGVEFDRTTYTFTPADDDSTSSTD